MKLWRPRGADSPAPEPLPVTGDHDGLPMGDDLPSHRPGLPLVDVEYGREGREHEGLADECLLSERCVHALEHFGAVVNLHSDVICSFDAHGERWTLVRAGTAIDASREGDQLPVASLRPVELAERWIVAAVGAQARFGRGEGPLPPYEQHATEELTQRTGFHEGGVAWHAEDGPIVAQLREEHAMRVYHFVAGRSIADIVTALS